MPRSRKPAADGDETQAPGFEESLADLEAIVEAMEHEHLSLEQLVEHYERGSTLLDRCDASLQDARNRIELITLRNQAEISLETPGKPDEKTAPTASTDDPDDDSNDIRLF
ncbi:MAG: exodeoxyribonuclease VII small subunit [Verrucomicrobiota bacterium]